MVSVTRFLACCAPVVLVLAVQVQSLEIESARRHRAGEFRSFDGAGGPYRYASHSILRWSDVDRAFERNLDLENQLASFRGRYAIRHAAVPGSVGNQSVVRGCLREQGLAEPHRYRRGERDQNRGYLLHLDLSLTA